MTRAATIPAAENPAPTRANNYYGRLCLALGVDPSDKSIKAKVQRGVMGESHVLWGGVNAWLEDKEGRLGVPTAHAFDYRVHVGVPGTSSRPLRGVAAVLGPDVHREALARREITSHAL